MSMPNVAPHAIAAAEALTTVAITTMFSHRELTHRSLELNDQLEGVARTIMKVTGVIPEAWAAVHLVHHGKRDANLLPFIELADYLDYHDRYGSETAVPEKFEGLDPVAVLSPDRVRLIGGLARKEVEGRYTPPTSYTPDEARRLLDPQTPRYFYPERPGLLKRRALAKINAGKAESLPLPDIYRLTHELRDPHSPALHRQGTRGVLKHNVGLYRDAAAYFTDPANRPAHLQGERPGEGERPSRLWMAGLFAGNIALAGLMRGGLKPKDLLGHALVGSGITLEAFGGLLAGGNITNSLGHGGEHPVLSLIKGEIAVKADGTFASNAPLLGPPTFDEVGGQDVHHDDPWRIAYTLETGWRGVLEAPFGSLLQVLADRGIGMRPGIGFNVPNDQRPDVAAPAVLELEKARVETLAQAG